MIERIELSQIDLKRRLLLKKLQLQEWAEKQSIVIVIARSF